MTRANAWLPEDWSTWLPSSDTRPVAGRPTGPTAPQPHAVAGPPQGLPVQTHPVPGGLWVVGVHGGAGESTLAALDPSWREAGHAWPVTVNGGPSAVVLAARTSAHGLLRAQAALTQWASAADAERSIQLLGLVLVADAPGKLPEPLRDLATIIGGGAPRTWQIAWNEAWRVGDESPKSLTRQTRQLITTLNALTPPAPAGA